MAYENQVIASFKRTHIVDVLEGDQGKAKNSSAIKAGTSTQSVKQRVRLDTTPVAADGAEYKGGDETVNSEAFMKEDGTSPIIEWRWLIDGKEASNSAQMPDPFHLGSYEDNGGCTPSLKLEAPVGGGRHKVEAFPFVRPEFNGGLAVEGKPAVWYCD